MANALRRKANRRKQLALSDLGINDMLTISCGPSRDQHGNLHCDTFRTVEELEAFWESNREVFMQLRGTQSHTHNHRGYFPGKRPWAWWQYDAPEPRNTDLHETEQLDRLGLLTETELKVLERDCKWPPANSMHVQYFDRPWAWWKWQTHRLETGRSVRHSKSPSSVASFSQTMRFKCSPLAGTDR